MTKQDLAYELARRSGLTGTQAKDSIDALMGIMEEAFIKGENIYLRGFGTFKVVTRKEKIGQDIKAGTAVVIPQRQAVVFKAAPVLKQAMN